MQRLPEDARAVIISVVSEVLAVRAPEEVAIYAVTSDDILRHVSSARVPDADSDAFFGGVEQTLGDILTHALALIAVEFLKHGWTLTRERLVVYLRERKTALAAGPSFPTAHAEAEILAVLDPGVEISKDEIAEISKPESVENQ